uniref:Uncharacterized protein n=1 Tax=Rhizophora mucronata TaxID=61149 RepID=A0A2P2QHE0_RHIMU
MMYLLRMAFSSEVERSIAFCFCSCP